jgi:hypothetical protein
MGHNRQDVLPSLGSTYQRLRQCAYLGKIQGVPAPKGKSNCISQSFTVGAWKAARTRGSGQECKFETKREADMNLTVHKDAGVSCHLGVQCVRDIVDLWTE